MRIASQVSIAVAALLVLIASACSSPSAPVFQSSTARSAQRVPFAHLTADGAASIVSPPMVTGSDHAAIPRFNQHTSPRKLFYSSDDYNGVIDIFDATTYAQIGQIQNNYRPVGLTTDSEGDLYATVQGPQAVKIYAAGHTKGAKQIVSDKGYNPTDLTLDANRDIIVANICSDLPATCAFNGSDQGDVAVFYAPDYAKSASLSDGCFYCFSVAVDESGNLWADGTDSNQRALIGYWPRGSGNFTQVNIALKFPGSIVFDRAGNLVLDDQSGSSNGGSEVFVFAPGSNRPSRSIILQTDGSDIANIALDRGNSRLYAGDINENLVRVFDYKTGSLLKTVHPNPGGLPIGVAAFPPPNIR